MRFQKPSLSLSMQILISLLLLLSACSKKAPQAQTSAPNYDWNALYKEAVQDASLPAESNDLFRELWSISSFQPQLQWKTIAGEQHLRVATWTAWDGYRKAVGSSMTLGREVWATPVPQLRDFCQTYQGPTALTLRLEQLLGLPPNNGKTDFVEMWVRPEDLFRPCPDPEIGDHECQGDFPNNPYFEIDDAYRKWFSDLQAGSYDPEKGYPWTRLGYTYDWSPETNKFGLSEFIAREGSIVWIESSQPSDTYCAASAESAP